MSKENLQFRIARLSALQAIVVAIIVAIGGIVTGYFGHERIRDVTASEPKRWLTIESLESTKFSTCRIVVSVNGYNYSYPSTAVWARVGAAPREHFALPSASSYRVAFRAIVDRGDEDAQLLESPEVQDFSAATPIRDQVYVVYPGIRVRGPSDSDTAIRLRYSIE